jgi:DNA primase
MKSTLDEQISAVAQASDIIDIIGDHITLDKINETAWRGMCPFHRDKSPRFHVSPKKQAYYCFGCNAGGSVFKFVMEYERVDFATALHRVALRVARKYRILSDVIGIRHKASGLLADYAAAQSAELKANIDWELHLLHHEAAHRDASLAQEIEKAHWNASLREE